MRRAVAVLARAPIAGRTKTRLAATIGDAAAAEVAEAFVRDAVGRDWPVDDRVLWRDGPHAVFDAAAAAGWTVAEQPGGDLGLRQAVAIAQALDDHDAVVVVGTDAPDLPGAIVEAAFAALGSHDVVLSPAYDGGYVLVGASRPCDDWFAGVAWGTDTVFASMCARAHQLGLDLALVPGWYDVDTVADIGRLALHSRLPHVGLIPAQLESSAPLIADLAARYVPPPVDAPTPG